MAKCVELGMIKTLPCIVNEYAEDTMRHGAPIYDLLIRQNKTLATRVERNAFAHPLNTIDHTPNSQEIYNS